MNRSSHTNEATAQMENVPVAALSTWSRVREWTGRLLRVGSAQGLIQALNLASGLLIIRSLSPQQYALYTLANSLLGTLSILSDGGISIGVMAEGGKRWQDRKGLGAVLATGRALRWQFAFLSMLLWAPFFLWQFRAHGASWGVSACVFLLLACSFGAILLGSMYSVAPNLWQRLRDTQRIALEQVVGRLGALFVFLGAFPTAFVAVAVAFAGHIWSVLRLKKVSDTLADSTQVPSAEVRREILKITHRTLPSTIYFCISSQVAIWLISVCGSSTGLAQIGALARLGQVFGVFSGVAGAVVVPRFARLATEKGLVLRRFFQAGFVFASVGAGVVGLVALFPEKVLLLLGREYAGLTGEVVLASAGSAAYFLSASVWGLASARGIVISPWLGIPSNLAVQVLLIALLDVHTVRGVLWLGVFMSAFELLLCVVNFLVALKRGGGDESETRA